MTGYEYICASIDIFELSLEKGSARSPIKTVAELARATGYSMYHFTRLFYAITGQNPKEYISGRILTEAEIKIAESTVSLACIAEQSGFADYETFSRAFKKRFHLTPKQVRNQLTVPFGQVPRIVPKIRINALNLASLEPETVEKKEHYITGIPFFVDYDTPSFHKQWAIFINTQKSVTDRVLPESFCQFSSWTTDESVTGLSVLCGLETEKGAVQEPLFMTRTVPAASYICFTHIGDISAIHETYEYIYRDWLATHDIKPLDLWEFQRYADDGRTTEIYIPIALL